ncbi:unnamed protein product, partial [Prorocentrum cordatum]
STSARPMASRAAARDAPGPLKAGSGVWAFYHAPSHRQGFRYVRLLESEEGGRPAEAAPGAGTVGLSTGWVEATVAEDWRPAEGGGKSAQVVVHLRGFFADPYRPDPEPVDCMYWKLGRGLVRPLDESRPPVELSLFVARWWQYDNPEARARSHNILHKGLMEDVLEGKGSPHEAFGTAGQYEVYTAFVRGGEDLDALGEGLAAQLHSRRRAALYFLWPSQRLGRERFAAGYVAERSLTGLMRRMEAGGVRTCWPHPVRLYEELATKRWAAALGPRAAALRVPPTVVVSKADVDGGAPQAAEAALHRLRRLRSDVHGGGPQRLEAYRGVAKLGFSWQGEGVLPFVGPAGLERALRKLLEGADPGATCLVQERVQHVRCELRVFCCRDHAAGPGAMRAELVRMRLKEPRHREIDGSFAMAGATTMTAAEAAEAAFGGSMAALGAAEAEARRLAGLWLEWLQGADGPGLPHVCRLDFMVSVPPAPPPAQPSRGPGGRGGARRAATPAPARAAPEVHTVEITELGGATCGLSVHARTVAVLNECVLGGGGAEGEGSLPPPAGFPWPLPPLQVGGAEGSVAARGARPAGAAVGAWLLGAARRCALGACVELLRPPLAREALLWATLLLLRLRAVASRWSGPVLCLALAAAWRAAARKRRPAPLGGGPPSDHRTDRADAATKGGA